MSGVQVAVFICGTIFIMAVLILIFKSSGGNIFHRAGIAIISFYVLLQLPSLVSHVYEGCFIWVERFSNMII